MGGGNRIYWGRQRGEQFLFIALKRGTDFLKEGGRNLFPRGALLLFVWEGDFMGVGT